MAPLIPALRTKAAACASRVRRQLTGRAALPLILAEKQLARLRYKPPPTPPPSPVVSYAAARESLGIPSDKKMLTVTVGKYTFFCPEIVVEKVGDKEALVLHMMETGSSLPVPPRPIVFMVSISRDDAAASLFNLEGVFMGLQLPQDHNQQDREDQRENFLHEAWHGYLAGMFPHQYFQALLEAQKACDRHPERAQEIMDTFEVVHDIWLYQSMREHGIHPMGISKIAREALSIATRSAAEGKWSDEADTLLVELLLLLTMPLLLADRGVDKDYAERIELYSKFVRLSAGLKRQAQNRAAFLGRALARRHYLTAAELVRYLDLR